MTGSSTTVQRSRLGATMRRDAWWLELIPIVIVLGGFSVYATWRAFEGEYYVMGSLPFSVLFPTDQTKLVAPLAGPPDPLGAAGVSSNLLLLS